MKENKQNGFVSIVICMTIMIILTMVTIGFARVMGREQRQALDRQLSSQAFYAAESGVNDVSRILKTNPSLENTLSCTTSGANDGANAQISSVGPVRVPCVQVDPTVTTLRFDPIATDPSRAEVIPLEGINGAGVVTPINRLRIVWTEATNTGSADFYSGVVAPRWTANTIASDWNTDTGVMKMTLIRFNTNDSRDAILQNQAIAYLYPTDQGSVTYDYATAAGTAAQGAVWGGSCTNASCQVDIRNIPAYDITSAGNSGLRLVLSSIYRNNNVSITAQDSSGNPLQMVGVQAIIDSTGRVGDTVRRIQVNKNLTGNYIYSAGAIQAQNGVCKKLYVQPFILGISGTTDPECGL